MSKGEMAYIIVFKPASDEMKMFQQTLAQSVLCTSLSQVAKNNSCFQSARTDEAQPDRLMRTRESRGLRGRKQRWAMVAPHHRREREREREQKQGLSNWVGATFHQRIQQIIQFRIRHTRKFRCRRAHRVCRRQTALKGLFNNNYISARRSHLITACRSLLPWPL